MQLCSSRSAGKVRATRPLISCIAIALICFAREGTAQVTLVPPFTGTHSETWEAFGYTKLSNGTPILGGIAKISAAPGTQMVTARRFQMCSVIGTPSDGAVLMDSDRPSYGVTISFSQAVSDFGAYWGSGYRCAGYGFDDSPSILTFYDVAGNVVGRDSFFYEFHGGLMWRGYHFARPVNRIERVAEDGLEGFAMDGLRATVAASGSGGARLSNLSTRSFVQTGDNVLIGGLIIAGDATKQVLLRALGPSLASPPANVPDVLVDPVLELHFPDGTILTNDNWQDAPNATSIPVTLRPSHKNDSALLVSLNPGAYTAVIRGVGDARGNALVEAYDLDGSASTTFANVSTRSFVQTDDNVMIAGLIIQGEATRDVVVRARGPSLAAPPFNVPNTLADPFLDLRDGNGNRIATNDNWHDTQAAQVQATGYAPSDPLEAAIVVTLGPGAYTAIVTGLNRTTGNALVEIYALQ